MIKKTGQGGFTLIEMAMVLIIGGLMLVTVLKGQTLIENFRLKRLMNDIESISIAYLTYFNRYNALPGDDPRNHGWNGVSRGNSNGWIEGNNPVDGNEAHEAWQALRWAGIIIGNPNATGNVNLPVNPYGGKYYLGNRNFGDRIGKRNYILIDNIAGNVAESIDIKYDDGVYNTGSVRATKEYIGDNVNLYYAI